MSDVERAAQGYRDFTGHEPKWVETRKLDDKPQAGYRMGRVVGIAYEATRDGERAQYFHRFAKPARPDLVAADNGKKLHIVGGNYKVTDRGIEDKTMPPLMIVNPSVRPSKRKSKTMALRRRKRTHSRRRRAAPVNFRRNPAPRRRRRSYARRRTRTVTVYRSNPATRRRRPRRMSVRRYRRNPMSLGHRLGGLNMGALVIPGVMIGGGAVLSEIGMGFMPIPASWKVGITRHFVKGAIGIGLGMVVAGVFKQRMLGEYMAIGAIGIATHDAIKDTLSTAAPSLQFGQYVDTPHSQFGFINPAQVTSAFSDSGMGEYVGTPNAQFGYVQ